MVTEAILRRAVLRKSSNLSNTHIYKPIAYFVFVGEACV